VVLTAITIAATATPVVPVAAFAHPPASAPVTVMDDQDVLLRERTIAAERPSRTTADRSTAAAVTVPKPVRVREHAGSPSRPPGKPSASVRPPAAGRAQRVIAFALSQVGKPYRWAAAGPNAYDCSGLALAAYARIGIDLPHQTGSILRLGQKISRSQLRPGDLVFPSSHHVGIFLGNGKMIHAPQTGDHVRVADVYEFYAGRRML